VIVDAIVDAYVAARDDLPAAELSAAFAIAYPLACFHHAVSYLRIENALEPSDRSLFGEAPREWLDRAVAAL